MLGSNWKIGDRVSLNDLKKNGVCDVYESDSAYYFSPMVEGDDLSVICRMDKNDNSNEATVEFITRMANNEAIAEFITHVANPYQDILTGKDATNSNTLW